MKKTTFIIRSVCIAALVTGAAFFVCRDREAGATDVNIILEGHGSRTSVGLSGFLPDSTGVDDVKLCRELGETLRNDLLFSRFVNIVEEGPLYTGQNDELQLWLDRGAELLVCGRASFSGKEIKLTGQLVDTGSRQVIWEKTFKGRREDCRQLAHELNDELILRLAGEKGIARSRIVFTNNATGTKELYVADYDGCNVRQLTKGKTLNMLPRWSPDGREILFTTYRFGNPDLYSLNLQTGKWHPLSRMQGLNSAATVSPDNRYIVLTVSNGGYPNLYLLDRSGSVIRRLTRGSIIDTSPSFAPNGREIVFISDRPGYPQLFIMDVESGATRRLTSGGFCDSPDWSPRGDRIVFTMRQGRDNFDLYVYDLTTERMTRLTQNEGNNENPSWSPDGRFIVFSSTRSGKPELYVIGADGAGLRKLCSLKGASSTPSWSP